MSEQLRAHSEGFDQIYRKETSHQLAESVQKTVTTLADVAIRFSFVERVPRYTPETRENDAEHSFMLALVAQDIAAEHFPELDAGLISRFSVVHDLLELETGDIATFDISDEALVVKRANEHTALENLCKQLPRSTALLLRAYEEQEIPEARFVRMVDKILPVVVDILGPGSQVMHEDYATHTSEDLEIAELALRTRFEAMFPDEALAPLHIARNSLARLFSDVFQPAYSVQDTLF